jgi:large-conductance mechanosensitive channel
MNNNNDLKLILENWNAFVQLVENEEDDKVYLFEQSQPEPNDSMSFNRLHERMIAGKLTEQKLYEAWEMSLDYELKILEEAGVLSKAAGALKKGAEKVTQAGKNVLMKLATFLYNKIIKPLIKMVTSATNTATIQKALNWVKRAMGSGSVNEGMVSKFMKHPFMQKYGKYIIAGLVLIATAAAVYFACHEILDLLPQAGEAAQNMDQIADKASEIKHVIESAMQIAADAGCDTCTSSAQELKNLVDSGASMSDIVERANDLQGVGSDALTSTLEQAVQKLSDFEQAGRGSDAHSEWVESVKAGKDVISNFADQKAQFLSKHPNASQASQGLSDIAQGAADVVRKRASGSDF